MTARRQQSKSVGRQIILLAVLVILIIGAWLYYFGIIDLGASQESALSNSDYAMKISKPTTDYQKIISELQISAVTGKFGDWPLGVVAASDNRGNPFIKKQK